MNDYIISFKIVHPNRDLKYILDALHVEAFRIWSAGEPRVTPRNTPLVGVHDNSYCCIRLPSNKAGHLDGALETFLKRLEQNKQLINELTDSGGKLAFFIRQSRSEKAGEIIDWPLIKRIADLKISIEIEF